MAGSDRGGGSPGAVDTALAVGVGLVAVAVILPTLLPGLGFWDTAEAQTVGPLLGTMHPTGFPAYVILGRIASVVLQPFGEPAYRMNLLSTLLVGVAAAGTVLVGRRLGVPTPLAAAAGLGLGVTPIAWRIGTVADVHALHLTLLVVLVLLLLTWERRVERRRDAYWHTGPGAPSADRWLVAAAAVYGVMLANHSLTLLLAPAIGLYVLAVDAAVLRRPRTVAAAGLALVGIAALLYLELPLRAGPFRAPLVYGHPETWDGFWYVVLAEQFRGSINQPFADLGGKLGALVELAQAQLGPLVLLVPIGFLAAVRQTPRYALLSGVATAITCFFAVSYENADIGRYYLGPAFFAWTWLALLGALAARVLAEALLGARRVGGGDAPVAPTAVALLLATALLVPTALDMDARYRALDRSQDTSAHDWMVEAYQALDPNAVVVSWWSYSTALWYGQLVEGRRPDVWVVDDRTRLDQELGEVTDVIDAYIGTRPVYVMRVSEAELLDLEARYRLEAVASRGLYRVYPPEAGR